MIVCIDSTGSAGVLVSLASAPRRRSTSTTPASAPPQTATIATRTITRATTVELSTMDATSVGGRDHHRMGVRQRVARRQMCGATCANAAPWLGATRSARSDERRHVVVTHDTGNEAAHRVVLDRVDACDRLVDLGDRVGGWRGRP